jgi:adenylate kinase
VDRLLKRAEIEGRSDDTAETIRRRQAIFSQETEPLLEVYRDRGLLVEVDGLGAVEEVSARLFAALDSRHNELATQ